MKLMLLKVHFVLLLACALAACAPQTTVLPTVIDLDGTTTAEAENAAATGTAVKSFAATNQPPTLPPTWTPSPEPSAIPAEAITGAMPTSAASAGSIYYIFNGDSVARLAADGSSDDLILVGSAPDDLTLSPDGQFLAYSAQGNGSAREVFISNLDGTYTQRISCLGFARILSPTWSRDGQRIAFGASQMPDGAVGVYIADVAGSGSCPDGNNQRRLAQIENTVLDTITWSNDGALLFFSSLGIYGLRVAEGELFPPLTSPSGYGPDFSLAHNPLAPQLFYLKTDRNDATGVTGGVMYQFSTALLTGTSVTEIRGAPIFVRNLRWSASGRYLLIATERDILLLDQRTNTSPQIVTGTNFYPDPVVSPDDQFVAYINGGAADLAVPQIYTIRRTGEAPTQLTFHQEGTIKDLNWGAE